MRTLLPAVAALALSTPAALADGGFDVYFLGEVHDNPAHHAMQAEKVAEIAPKAVVWEMLTADLASEVTSDTISDAETLGETLAWESRGWPDFDMYYPIFAASPDARHYGAALPREEARRVMGEPVGTVFGEGAARFGLESDLPEAQQAAREAMQLASHCDALPVEMLPMMVSIQRLRDARLAEVALAAFEATGGPVAVITGNGHARKDWGAPALLALAAPDLRIFALGQGETGNGGPDGGFDELVSAPAVDRPDPCAEFRTR